MNQVAGDFIDKLWNEYDTNRSGYLEEAQAKKLMLDILAECTGGQEVQVEDTDLDELFKEFDLDQTGKISRQEFRVLLKEASGM